MAADIGNTAITLGAFRGPRLLRRWSLPTRLGRGPEAYGRAVRALLREGLPRAEVGAFVFGSVVPELDAVFSAMARRRLGVVPVVVTPRSALGIRLRVRTPAEVGVDRVLNALAAHRLYGSPAVVLDFGTATTFDCVGEGGEYLGGSILIGPALAARGLAWGTSKLPEVSVRPARAYIGKDTAECIRVGLFQGYLGMVREVLRGTLKELPSARGRVIVTGGWGGAFSPHLPRNIPAPDLTLQGLRLAHELISH
ncbi:MAG: type III pantothenate kinase [Elusimicrobiota bacterium]